MKSKFGNPKIKFKYFFFREISKLGVDQRVRWEDVCRPYKVSGL